MMIRVEAGDAIIFPAGVSHCSVDFEDYRYMGVYPEVRATDFYLFRALKE